MLGVEANSVMKVFVKLQPMLFLVVLFFFCANAQALEFDHSHRRWQELLTQYVHESDYASRVDYQAWQKDQKPLQAYLATVSSVDKQSFDNWTKPQQLAFLINAYNAFTVNLVLQHYPVDSIKNIGSFFRSTWKIKFFQLFGEEHHLDYIEHELIRGGDRFHEPRIHFALVCASIGCPKLQATAFTEQNLEQLLQNGETAFLADQSRNRYNAANKTLYLSSIFKWYGEDFEKKAGSVLNYALPIITKGTVKVDGQAIKFLDYNWGLNEVRGE